MSAEFRLKEKYVAARCCSPAPGDSLTGYFSHEDQIKVHRADCPNLAKAPPERLVSLTWDEILDQAPFEPDTDYAELEAADFAILKHHREMDIDYSLKEARVLNLPKQEVFDRHHKLREFGLLERVEPLIVQYRKGIVKNKWIKHRNHTYYQLTARGTAYLDYHLRTRQ